MNTSITAKSLVLLVTTFERQTFVLLGWLLLAMPVAVQAQFTYTVTNGTIVITGYTGSGIMVVIPDMIGGLPVTAIGHDAFSENGTMSTVTIPSSVTSIGDSAFINCASLTFVTIPNSVIRIGEGAFFGCISLTAIDVETNNRAYTSVGGVLFNQSLTTLITYPGGKAGSYSIPNTVTKIGLGAFNNCISMTSVTIPNSVTSIGDGAFYYCTSLTSVTIPNGVTSIGADAFSNCSSLTSVSIPSTVTSIGEGAFFEGGLLSITLPTNVTTIGYTTFYGCTSLTNVTIPNSVTNIGDAAFSSCENLASVTIPESVTSIGSGAFFECIKLVSITIGTNVANIGDLAFGQCHSLAAINVETNNPAYSSLGEVLFNRSQTTLIECPGSLVGSYAIPNSVTSIGIRAFEWCSLATVTIPNSVTNIGDGAFDYSSLTNITLPNSVTSIGYSTFEGCAGLENVTIASSVTNIEGEAFAYCSSLSGVYFKGNAPSFGEFVFGGLILRQSLDPATAYYLPGTTGWDSTTTGGLDPTFGGIPTALWLPQVRVADTSFGVNTNQFGFSVSWAEGMSVVVEASPSLSNPVWSPLVTNTLSGSIFYFTDPMSTNYPSRFYRVRSQ